MIVNNIQRLNSLVTKMAEMGGIEEKIVNMEEKIDQNSDTIADVNSTVERNSVQIGSLTETRIALFLI